MLCTELYDRQYVSSGSDIEYTERKQFAVFTFYLGISFSGEPEDASFPIALTSDSV